MHGRERDLELRLVGRLLGDGGVRWDRDAYALGFVQLHGEQRDADADVELQLGRKQRFADARGEVPRQPREHHGRRILRGCEAGHVAELHPYGYGELHGDGGDLAELHADGRGGVRDSGDLAGVQQSVGLAELHGAERHGHAKLRGWSDHVERVHGVELQRGLSRGGGGVRRGHAELRDCERHGHPDVDRERLRDVHGGELQQRLLRIEQHGLLAADVLVERGQLRTMRRGDDLVFVWVLGLVHGRERDLELRLVGRLLGDGGVWRDRDADALGVVQLHGEQRRADAELELQLEREHWSADTRGEVPRQPRERGSGRLLHGREARDVTELHPDGAGELHGVAGDVAELHADGLGGVRHCGELAVVHEPGGDAELCGSKRGGAGELRGGGHGLGCLWRHILQLGVRVVRWGVRTTSAPGVRTCAGGELHSGISSR